MSAEVLKFPHSRKHVIQSLIATAQKLEESSPRHCILVQKDIITLMASECTRSLMFARAVKRALDASNASEEES